MYDQQSIPRRNIENNPVMSGRILLRQKSLSCVAVSPRYNAVHSTDTFHKIMTQAAIRNTTAAALCQALPGTPTDEWFRRTASDTAGIPMEKGFADRISQDVKIIKKKNRQLPRKPTVAIDKHLIPRYDKKPDEHLVRSKRKGGTTS